MSKANAEKEVLKEQTEDLKRQNHELLEEMTNTKALLQATIQQKDQMLLDIIKQKDLLIQQAINERDQLKEKYTTKSKQKTQLHKDIWKLKKKKQTLEEEASNLYTEEDLQCLEDRVSFLSQKNKEIEQLLALMEDDVISTFENGKYTDEIREAIMELLQMNVSMTKVKNVIRTVLKKLAAPRGRSFKSVHRRGFAVS